MQITKCDQCQRIKSKDIISYDADAPWVSGSVRGQGVSRSFDLCESCGQPLVAYIKRLFKIKNITIKK